MAKKKRPTPKPRTTSTQDARPLPPPAPAPPPARSKAPWFIAGGIAVVVALAAIVAVAASGGDDDDSAAQDTTTTAAVVGPTSPATTLDPSATVPPAEYQPVTVTGDALPRFGNDGDDPAVGSTPPTLQGYSFDGTPIEIDPSAGRSTMVVFLAHWCPHCNREVPRLVEWYQDGGVPPDLDVIGVSTGADESAPNWPPSEWIADEGWPWPIMADDEDQTAAQAYGLPGYPYFVIIGEDGTVKHRQSGEIEIDDLEQIITSALS